MLIGIDFDGTLVNGSEAIAGAREAINLLREQGHKVMIYSCNNKSWIEKVMQQNDMRYDYIYDGCKPVCHLYIDDRNIAFNGDWNKALSTIKEMGTRPII